MMHNVTFDRILGGAIVDATRTVEKRLRAGTLRFDCRADRDRAIAELAAERACELSPRLQGMQRERLVTLALGEIGN